MNSKLSLQKHQNRAEFWQIIKGNCKVTVAKKEYDLEDNDNIYIPKNTLHRIENTGTQELIFIEIQLGMDIKEEDIVRIEDDYGRI
jgi:mannose-6-phosphate isomerase-like protein (cupin superfamily)